MVARDGIYKQYMYPLLPFVALKILLLHYTNYKFLLSCEEPPGVERSFNYFINVVGISFAVSPPRRYGVQSPPCATLDAMCASFR